MQTMKTMKTMKTTHLMKSVALVSGLLLSIPAFAAEPKLVGPFEGEAAVVPGNEEQTKNNAMRDARRKAIESGAGLIVSSNTIVRNFELVADEIATSAKGVITDEKWDKLTDGATGSTKKIKLLSAKVSQDPGVLGEAACAVVKQNHNPKVSLVFVEKIGDEATSKWTPERGLVESMFTSAFKDACFTIVESGVKVTEVSANGDLPQETIQQIIKNSNAQYVVLGSGKITKMMKGEGSVLGTGNMNSYSVAANLKLMNTATNEIEAVASKSNNILGISPEHAFKAGGEKVDTVIGGVMDEMMKKITVRWSSDLVNSGHVNVLVRNVPNFAAAKAFKELMAKVSGGADNVQQRSVTGGEATFDVSIAGGAEELASQIEDKKAGKFTVEVIEVTRGKVIVKLKG